MDAMPSSSAAAIAATPDSASVLAAARSAARRIAPLWPLDSFVAVNPYFGLADHRFAEAAASLTRTAGARSTMPRAFYAAALADGRMTLADLSAALASAPLPSARLFDAGKLAAFAVSSEGEPTAPLDTLADIAGRRTRRDWAGHVVGRISSFAARHFDGGQASWRNPSAPGGLYAAWKAEAAIDRAPEIAGIAGFRATVAALPDDRDAMLVESVERLALTPGQLPSYFERLLRSVGGWAAFARGRDWAGELAGKQGETVVDVLAIRLAHEVALYDFLSQDALLRGAFAAARRTYAAPIDPLSEAGDCLLQSAYEHAWQRRLLPALLQPTSLPASARPAAQAVFCIDVRSEVFRRALETVAPDVETLGFAGFFGVAIDHVAAGGTATDALYPVLLQPRFMVCDAVSPDAAAAKRLGQDAGRVMRGFRGAAVSSFAFVEAAGLGYLAKLAADSLQLGRRGDAAVASGRPELDPAERDGRLTGIPPADRLASAASILRGMGLTDNLARVVVLVGHGATTRNNPHAAGLSCGACGGHSGDANARVAAAILNDPAVRAGLVGKGITIPADTLFVAALHDTTTDLVSILDAETLPRSRAHDIALLKAQLAEAGRAARIERAPRLGIESDPSAEARVMARARDWSEVRPEWGLAGCAAFIAAPRALTRGLDLGGRAFLHSYDWRKDDGFKTLELILTAPLVVATWINLQYYASTVDNRVFGSGNKVLHNVVGGVGVLEGAGGDLRVGLPMQSISDGRTLVHEPLRLTAVIAAPIDAIDRILCAHDHVRVLVENGWIHLLALDGGTMRRRTAAGWKAVAAN